MANYYLTNAAEQDFKDIMSYTLAEWGSNQVYKYRDLMESRLRLLAKFPEVGRSHIHLPEHILYVVEGKHYLFYRIVNDGIEILRLLHSRMDILKNISEHL